MITFNRTNSTDPHFQNLVTLLDADLQIRDGDEHAFYAQFNSIENLQHVIVCYVDDAPVGCGAFKKFTGQVPGSNEKKVEIKRIFVLPKYRGKGLGLHILQALEEWAMQLHYRACILETGKKQPEAIRLYLKAGYAIIKNYGQYKNVENSVCMQKLLAG